MNLCKQLSIGKKCVNSANSPYVLIGDDANLISCADCLYAHTGTIVLLEKSYLLQLPTYFGIFQTNTDIFNGLCSNNWEVLILC